MTQRFSFDCQCKGKRKFTRRKWAKIAMRHLYSAGTSPRNVSVYRCPHCEFYHIGRQQNMVRQNGFGSQSLNPWTFRLHDVDGPVASFKIAAIDGERLTQETASRTVALMVSLLQQPGDSGSRARLEAVLSASDADALIDIAAEIDSVFWIDVIDATGRRVGQGHSEASGKLPSTRKDGPIRQIDPAHLFA